MATLTVWKFDTSDGARTALDLLRKLQEQQLITIRDTAYVYWEEGAKRPKTKELGKLTGAGTLGGAFWGLLFGLIFFIPVLGAAIGAGVGALAGSLSRAGIDDEFVQDVRESVTPGTSALFVMSEHAVIDKVAHEFKKTGAQLITTNLSVEEEKLLKETFTA
ncbi:DUF1269 domain-containing protein [Lentzea sp. NPDC006480]|uniref:DUF1269 domain-containing protein n=1 Tax=Lentzea sp. NPDC006480 TaxID=3157176 RepID=UPI0033A3498B